MSDDYGQVLDQAVEVVCENISLKRAYADSHGAALSFYDARSMVAALRLLKNRGFGCHPGRIVGVEDIVVDGVSIRRSIYDKAARDDSLTVYAVAGSPNSKMSMYTPGAQLITGAHDAGEPETGPDRSQKISEPTVPCEWADKRDLVGRFFLGDRESNELDMERHWRELRKCLNGLEEQAVTEREPEKVADIEQVLGPRPIPDKSPLDSNGKLNHAVIERCKALGGISPSALWDRERENLLHESDEGAGFAGVYQEAFNLILGELYTGHFDIQHELEEAKLIESARQIIPTGSKKRRFGHHDENGRPLRELLMEEVEAGLALHLSWAEVARNYLRRQVWHSPIPNPESNQPLAVYLTVEDAFVGQRRGPLNSLSDAEWRMIFLLRGDRFGLSPEAAAAVSADLLRWYLGRPNTSESLRKRARRAGMG